MDYGIIGNHNTASLISKQGSIDWFCFPRFDSPSVFAKLLDENKGGFFCLPPLEKNYSTNQTYVSNTNVIETKIAGQDFEYLIHDFFPCYIKDGKLNKVQQIIRILKPIRGNPSLRFQFEPRLNYALDETRIIFEKEAILAKNDKQKLTLRTNLSINDLEKGYFVLREPTFFGMSFSDNVSIRTFAEARTYFDLTCNYWIDLLHKISVPDQYQEAVIRSFLTLELLTYKNSGAIVAAATTSLPEIVGKDRNWDYRYAWLRDASFAVDSFTKLCHFDEAEGFMKWIIKICLLCSLDLQIMYGVEGERNLEEKILSHLSGYKNSKPVRIGNGAYTQTQIDVVGEVLQAAYLYFVYYHYTKELTFDQWDIIEGLVEYVISNWRDPDNSIWEFRNVKRHFTFSKLMSWVALDRGIKIAHLFHKEQVVSRWIKVRKEIQEDILKNGWNNQIQAFTQYYGSKEMDASLLLMPYFGFLEPNDHKIKKTVENISKNLVTDGLVYRYRSQDDFGIPENGFLPCNFWLADALFLTGEKDKAKKLFEKTLKYSNHLGLFSEHIKPETYEQTGNFPQAYTHIALINTATLLTQNEIRKPVCKLKLEV